MRAPQHLGSVSPSTDPTDGRETEGCIQTLRTRAFGDKLAACPGPDTESESLGASAKAGGGAPGRLGEPGVGLEYEKGNPERPIFSEASGCVAVRIRIMALRPIFREASSCVAVRIRILFIELCMRTSWTSQTR